MNNHGAGCCCYGCESQREKSRHSEHAGVAWENNGSGHGAGCSCYSCESQRTKRHNDIDDRYTRRR